MDSKDLEIGLIPSPHDPCIGAHVGVRVRHKMLNLIVECVSKNT